MTTPVPTVAAALLQAHRTGRPADAAPLAGQLQTPADAYAVQDEVARGLGWFGDAGPRHWKSGGPSRQAALTHAPLPPGNVRSSPAGMRDVPFQLRLIEAEIALRLGRDVTAAQAAALTHDGAPSWLDGMAVSIEIVDSRWQQARDAETLLKLADLQSHGALALGDWRPFEARDWSAQECRVRIGAGPWQTFRGTHSLGDPAWLLPLWLRHATRHGATVGAGTVVTTGTWCGLLSAQAGDRVEVEFPGVGTAAVQL
ncbi:MAG TPA: fumarylacetoacetate hydrolase family protein [Ramlibacter sp.]|jgi:2-keto-4-pentenoate hydratase|uniref:fumarylacetoacetate hydrolase family protein n=1 Tax=Ramlibacter sp. TaxID=1917967 RepID=UPI002D439A9A|nr:fumarylacetoacetate hydrolase family protein [Ramlibacter sp.]HZY18041.1 fumarylacetoacetate hydrolase family protein [Ramlibacter sp.]